MSIETFPFRDSNDGTFEADFHQRMQSETLTQVQLPLGGTAWLACRFAHVKAVLTSGDLSRTRAESTGVPRFSNSLLPPTTLMGMDPPRHTAVRRAIAPLFSTTRVEQCRHQLRDLSTHTVTQIAGVLPADLVPHVRTHSVLSMGILLGMAPDQCLRFDALASAVMAVSVSQSDQWRRRGNEFEAEIRRWINRTDHDSSAAAQLDDIIHAGELTQAEVIQVVRSLFLGGVGAPTAFLAGAVHTLLTTPELYTQLSNDTALVTSAVDELLRVVPTGVTGATRVAVTDCVIGDTHVSPGEVIVPVPRAGNKDAAMFDDPFTTRLDRPRKTNLAFGYGSHYCPGAHLSRAQAQEFLSALTTRLPTLRINSVTWAPGSLAQNLTSLIVSK